MVGNNSGTIEVRASNNCGTSNMQTLTVLSKSIPEVPAAILGELIVNVGDMSIYTCNLVSGANNYTWTLNIGGNILSGQLSNAVTIKWLLPGIYELSVQANNECGMSSQQKISIEVIDPDPNDAIQITVVPNPSSGLFQVRGRKLQDKFIQMEVMTLSGQLMLQKLNLRGENYFSQSLDLQKFSTGIYIIRFTVDKKSFLRKISIIK